MNTCTTTFPAMSAGGPPPPAAIVAAWANRVRRWRADRARKARDRDALAQMSDRELRDIGVDRGLLDFAASGAWQRDTPR